ncbi:hypothetical protein JCM30471_32310 [Desulfuromonas carbonis]|uniref:Spy/CpxP family protein refolding chaperone n=1 Tax=Desulfuromonas sp. DDH964 TaxID=1823759 RepID=UPI00078B43B1|nr:Spy/CpxP family protein refolding chaperone [Desulfuromonas sp. DDH964]AMV71392.1 CpxP superfamily protein [Desulfuromonas sp. DDH964]
MKKSLLPILLFTATLVGGSFLPLAANAAQPGNERRQGEGRDQRQERMAEILGLSAEQQASIAALIEAERAANAPLRERLRANREQMHQAVTAETFDESAVRALAASQVADRTELLVSHARAQHLSGPRPSRVKKSDNEKGFPSRSLTCD